MLQVRGKPDLLCQNAEICKPAACRSIFLTKGKEYGLARQGERNPIAPRAAIQIIVIPPTNVSLPSSASSESLPKVLALSQLRTEIFRNIISLLQDGIYLECRKQLPILLQRLSVVDHCRPILWVQKQGPLKRLNSA